MVPLEHRIDVIMAIRIRAVEGDDVHDVEDHVDEAEEKGTPEVMHAMRSAAHPSVDQRCHGLEKN